MKFKKILSVFLATAISASSLSVVSSAQTPQTVAETVEKTYLASGDSFVKGGFKYTELDDGTLEVECDPNSKETITNAVIPKTVNGKKVTIISGRAFESCPSLTSVTIPNSVTSIGDSAFNGCTNLKSVTIPNSVTNIGGVAFSSTSLASVTIPNSVTNIGFWAFLDCKSLKSVTISNSVTKIDLGTFDGCTSLVSVIIPKSVTSIGYDAFSDCTSLNDVYYTGTKTQWDNIKNNGGNDAFKKATIHYNHNLKIADLKAAPTNNSVKLTWSKSASASYYKVFAWKDNKWAQLIKTANNTTLAYTASSLEANTSYKYRVTAYNSNGIAISYSDITAKTKYGTIANLKAAPTDSTVKLTWSKYAAASYYKVFIWKNSKWTQLTKTGSNATVAYTASKLVGNTSYKFRVTAYNSSGKAIAYSDITAKTKYGTIANLKAAPTSSTVKLTWSKNTSASYYKVFIWKNSKWTQLTKTGSNATVAYTASNLVGNTSYKFRVTAYNSSDTAIAYSDITSKTKYGTIANLKAAPTDSTVKLTWGKNTSASYYKVFIWKNSKWTQLTKTGSNATVAYTASKLVGNTSYKFRVTAYNSSDTAIAYSDITSKTKYGTIANLKATPTSSTVKLTWGKNASASYYKVFIWKDSKWTQLTKTGSNATVAYTASKLTANTSYKFRVTAYNSSDTAIAYSDITAKTTA